MVGLLVLSSCIGIRIGSGTDLVGSPLWHHDDAPDFLHLGVVGRADSIQVACNLQGTAKVSLMVGSRVHVYQHLNRAIHVHRPIG